MNSPLRDAPPVPPHDPLQEATDVIRRVLEQRDDADPIRLCVTSSFQAECVVLLHLLHTAKADPPVLFIDTAHHFPETLSYANELARAWQLNVVTLRATVPAVGHWRDDITACCRRHKVEPLFAELDKYDVWFTALRRDQSQTRADLAAIAPFSLPTGRTLTKVSPLAAWTSDDVFLYARIHDIPLLPLYQRGYTSIGCAPCTLPPLDPANPRSGRWSGRKLECGIHIEGADPS